MKTLAGYSFIILSAFILFQGCKKADKAVACIQSSVSTAQVGQNISFTSCSTGGETYLWSFGDGQTANTADAVHSFSAAGTYTVTLTVTNAEGSAQSTATVTITGTTGAPFACIQASATSIHTGDTVTFTSCSNNATSYLWDFGDGSTAATAVVTHVFNSASRVTLTASNGTGSDTATVDIVISGPGRNDFLGTYNCVDACSVTGTVTYSNSITASGINPIGIVISNFSNYGQDVNATVNGSDITIPSQSFQGGTVSGTGTLNSTFTTITYTANFTIGGESEVCNGTMQKQ
jgi:VCBS repeat-containing protein